MMTAKFLKEYLSTVPDDYEIVASVDIYNPNYQVEVRLLEYDIITKEETKEVKLEVNG